MNLICLGTFGRRASDGGANLQIYYPTTCGSGGTATGTATGTTDRLASIDASNKPYESPRAAIDEANEEIQGFDFFIFGQSCWFIIYLTFRYMHSRGSISEDHPTASGGSIADTSSIGGITSGTAVPSGGGSRTRRSGLLTVMERPPGKHRCCVVYFVVTCARIVVYCVIVGVFCRVCCV